MVRVRVRAIWGLGLGLGLGSLMIMTGRGGFVLGRSAECGGKPSKASLKQDVQPVRTF